jgi:dynein assembly factor 1
MEDTQDPPQLEEEGRRITKKYLKQLCRAHDLYNTPELNDKLYLQYKEIIQLENLEEYTGLKVLWLEGNAIRKIENLDNQKEMKCLYNEPSII